MQLPTSSKKLWFLIAIGATLFFFAIVSLLPYQGFYLKPSAPETQAPQNLMASVWIKPSVNERGEPPVNPPIHLTIPVINIDTTLEYVGLTAKGAVDTPKVPTRPAWFKLSSRPGAIGNAVIVGHFGWKNGIPAVFDDLDQVHKGDKVFVKDEQGVTTTFVVREIKLYRQNEDTSDVFVSGDGKAHMNLITCAGTWSKILKSYSHRLVVFTDKEVE